MGIKPTTFGRDFLNMAKSLRHEGGLILKNMIKYLLSVFASLFKYMYTYNHRFLSGPEIKLLSRYPTEDMNPILL